MRKVNYGWFDQLINSTYQILSRPLEPSTVRSPNCLRVTCKRRWVSSLNRSDGIAASGRHYADGGSRSLLQNIPWDAGYRTTEAFAEIRGAPLLKDARTEREGLDLDLQAR